MSWILLPTVISKLLFSCTPASTYPMQSWISARRTTKTSTHNGNWVTRIGSDWLCQYHLVIQGCSRQSVTKAVGAKAFVLTPCRIEGFFHFVLDLDIHVLCFHHACFEDVLQTSSNTTCISRWKAPTVNDFDLFNYHMH